MVSCNICPLISNQIISILRIYHRCRIQKTQDIMDYIIIFMMSHPFQQDTVRICNGQWTEQVSLQVSDITECLAQQLYLSDNHRATIVKEIAHIHFTALTTLRLGGNRIESVEGLARVHMAQIETVDLDENNITSVGVMRKAAWPRLQQLYIRDNYFGDANNLVYGCFLQIKTLSMYYPWGHDGNGFSEQCFPAKIQAASLQQLSIRRSKFCFNRCLETVLQQRWPDTKGQ